MNTETRFIQHAGRRPFRFLSCCGVDCSDGEMEMALWGAIDRFHRAGDGEYFGRAMPCYGDAAQSRLMRYYDLKPHEWRRGKRESGTCDWIENPKRSDGIRKHFANVPASLLYDANTAKTRRDAAWRTQVSHYGAASLFDWPEPDYIEMYARQQCAEEYAESYKSNLRYLVWRMKRPRFADNEFLDTDAGCWAMANYVGVEFASASGAITRRRVAVVRPTPALIQEDRDDRDQYTEPVRQPASEPERRRHRVGIVWGDDGHV